MIEAGHPEAVCEECGCKNVTWFAPSDIWNAVVRTLYRNPDPMLCPTCFIRRAEAAGYNADPWKVAPEFHVPTSLVEAGH